MPKIKKKKKEKNKKKEKRKNRASMLRSGATASGKRIAELQFMGCQTAWGEAEMPRGHLCPSPQGLCREATK